jgi:hypothetical protein
MSAFDPKRTFQGTQGSSDERGSMALKIKFLANKNKTRIPKRLN